MLLLDYIIVLAQEVMDKKKSHCYYRSCFIYFYIAAQ